MSEPVKVTASVVQTTPVMTNHPPKPPVAEALIPSELADNKIIAKPLVSPDFLNLRPKNPNIKLRWVNCAVPNTEKGGVSTLRFEQAKAQGYLVAHADDVINPPDCYLHEGRSKLINGDLILMKIDAAAYLGALKWKDQQARRLGSRRTMVDKGNE